jgi:chromosome partitioning protein
MLMKARTGKSASAHVIVVGNEKGGTGKSTIAMHVAVALMNVGQRVATIDLDSRQKSFTHYIENRHAWERRVGVGLRLPIHFWVARASTMKVDDNESIEFTGFADALAAAERSSDFIVIDTAGADSYLTRLAHSMADTLLTPLNDSFVDFDVLGIVDPESYAVVGDSHYAAMVKEARLQRRLVDGLMMDWVVVRNRMQMLSSRNRDRIGRGLDALTPRLGFRTAQGLAERVVYRELFPRGLTVLDDLDEAMLGTRPNLSHVSARAEVLSLIETLNLALDPRGSGRMAARAQWQAASAQPLELDDMFAPLP